MQLFPLDKVESHHCNLAPAVGLTFCILQLARYEFILAAMRECEIYWSSWQAASHTNTAYTQHDREHDKDAAHAWDPSEAEFVVSSLLWVGEGGGTHFILYWQPEQSYIFKVKCIISIIPKQFHFVADTGE